MFTFKGFNFVKLIPVCDTFYISVYVTQVLLQFLVHLPLSLEVTLTRLAGGEDEESASFSSFILVECLSNKLLLLIHS